MVHMRGFAAIAVLLGAMAKKTMAANEYNDGIQRDFDALYKRAVDWHPEWTPNTPEYRSMMDYRAAQVARIKDSQQRYDGYLVLLQQGIEVVTGHQSGLAP